MNKHLAHISYEKADREWNHTEWIPVLEAEMRAAWRLFLSAVDDKWHNPFCDALKPTAKRMLSRRAALDRFLDPENDAITLSTLQLGAKFVWN